MASKYTNYVSVPSFYQEGWKEMTVESQGDGTGYFGIAVRVS